MRARLEKCHSICGCRQINSIDLKAVDCLHSYISFLYRNNMDIYYYSRYDDLYIFYHADDRLPFLMKTPKGGFRQELHSVHFL